MSKRQEIRLRRRRAQLWNRILVVLLVVAGAALIFFVLVLPGLKPQPVGTIVQVTPRALNVPTDKTHLGNPDAPVKFDLYEDFRCSACLYYTQNIEPQVIQNYVQTGKVYYSYHTYLVIDSNDGSNASYQSANAALCAAEQGRFWDYHDTLYANQTSEQASLFSDVRLVAMAQNLKLDMNAFNQCFRQHKYAPDVQNDISQGRSLNVAGTPSFFVNGALVKVTNITQAYSNISQAIDAALAGH